MIHNHPRMSYPLFGYPTYAYRKCRPRLLNGVVGAYTKRESVQLMRNVHSKMNEVACPLWRIWLMDGRLVDIVSGECCGNDCKLRMFKERLTWGFNVGGLLPVHWRISRVVG
jgi:hypothetical protein